LEENEFDELLKIYQNVRRVCTKLETLVGCPLSHDCGILLDKIEEYANGVLQIIDEIRRTSNDAQRKSSESEQKNEEISR